MKQNKLYRIRSKFLLLIFLCSGVVSPAQDKNTGIFKSDSDIGNPKNPGSVKYNEEDQSYTLRGAGYNIWFERDEFNYLFNKITGNFILTANFKFSGKGVNHHRKTGWMIRWTTDEKSPHISGVLHGDGLTVLQWRPSPGAVMRDPQDQIFAAGSAYDVIQVERAGKKIIMRAAHFGEPFDIIGSHEMDNMPDEVLAGLFICSHDTSVTEEVKVWNVRIDQLVADELNSGRIRVSGLQA